ncbi:UDP-GlcNAc:betaGal beta-1,3-N-acetylglucosaminyltransferase 7 [Bombina bombina]|uniref:UDP-GlcNAc:betaGal beta-1,3-N-acetylglucosaminyltransferase 7 n=1 Tax=Bombina bombina TaxID=8345 RepID=UPI00235AFE1F|nr:UDP-GlcNAc:betaGal beta-1,3-N-acetylglucosaminyltransferase 7 [Bombina bombina]
MRADLANTAVVRQPETREAHTPLLNGGRKNRIFLIPAAVKKTLQPDRWDLRGGQFAVLLDSTRGITGIYRAVSLNMLRSAICAQHRPLSDLVDMAYTQITKWTILLCFVKITASSVSTGLTNRRKGRKIVYKSLCLSFCLVIALTVLQRGTAPGLFMEGSLKFSGSGSQELMNAQKRDTHPIPSSFWANKVKKQVAHDLLSTESSTVEWDVNSINCTTNWNLTHLDWFKTIEPNFQQFLLYRHCRYFPIIINNPQKCSDDVELLIVVKSIITQHDRREAIRKTWGKEKEVDGKKVRTLFLLGTAMKEEERANYQKLLEFENLIYRDILQWNFLDSFFNLTLKEVHFLKWMTIYCHGVKYIFKGDDDVFVSPDNILEYLSINETPDLFVGDVLFKAYPIRKKENKYYIPTALYNKTSYPPYAGGGGFLMAGPLVKRLYKASESLELYPIDDVFLGMCLEVIKVSPIKHEGFRTFGIVKNKSSKMNREPCFFKSMMVVHKLLPDDLMHMWKLVHSNLTCSRKLNIL